MSRLAASPTAVWGAGRLDPRELKVSAFGLKTLGDLGQQSNDHFEHCQGVLANRQGTAAYFCRKPRFHQVCFDDLRAGRVATQR